VLRDFVATSRARFLDRFALIALWALAMAATLAAGRATLALAATAVACVTSLALARGRSVDGRGKLARVPRASRAGWACASSCSDTRSRRSAARTAATLRFGVGPVVVLTTVGTIAFSLPGVAS